MTKFAEVIFETGAKSLLSYDSEDELKGFLSEHHNRALKGIPGATQDQVLRADLDASDFAVMPSIDTMKSRPAERISKVYLYDENPADLHDPKVSVETVQNLVEGMSGGTGAVNPEQLVAALRDEASPVYTLDQGRLESNYKADATGELDLAFLKSSSGGDA